jgi:hypothetical protein
MKPAPFIFQLMPGQTSKRHSFLNRALQNINRQLFGRRSNDIDPQPVIGSSDGGLARLLPRIFKELSATFMAPFGGIFPKTHLRWMNRHICVQTDFPGTIINGDRYKYDEEIEEKILNRHLSTLSHLTLQPFRRWPNLLLETEERETLRSPGQSDEENLKVPAAFIDKRIRYLTDKSSRENNVFSMLRPPKMKLAVSERKAAPDLRGELQNIERRLKSIKPTESSPPQSNIDIHQISERVYDEIERKLRIERERRGL